MNDLDPAHLPQSIDLSPGVHDLEGTLPDAPDLQGISRLGWATTMVDLGAAKTKADILEAVARGLAFPEWVGRNWDALDDALDDLSWWPPAERGRLLVVRGAAQLRRSRPDDTALLIDILRLSARRWSQTDTPLVVLVEG